MSIFEQARALGKDILECEEAQKLYAARESFEKDETAKVLVDQYAKLKDKWTAIMEDKEADKSILTELGEEIMAKEEEIKNHTITFNLMQAESQFGAFVNSVFSLISATVQGEETPQNGGCDPSACSSCSGCH
jgi:Protein of unknown function (DUF964).